jgi:hypothetical protein
MTDALTERICGLSKPRAASTRDFAVWIQQGDFASFLREHADSADFALHAFGPHVYLLSAA